MACGLQHDHIMLVGSSLIGKIFFAFSGSVGYGITSLESMCNKSSYLL